MWLLNDSDVRATGACPAWMLCCLLSGFLGVGLSTWSSLFIEQGCVSVLALVMAFVFGGMLRGVSVVDNRGDTSRRRKDIRCAVARDGPEVIGLGAAAIDLLAGVNGFPNPDDKVRTESFEVAGGGNCGNTLIALRRLGLACSILTKVGDDATGKMITDEFVDEGVDTAHVVVKEGMKSPFTYVLVDLKSGTRTCIHTPAEEDLLEVDVKEEWLESAAHVHLDGRHTLAALKVARMAIERSIPVSLDVEKDRPHIRELLPLADYIITNARYPNVFAEDFYTGMKTLLELGRAKFVISTLGSEGSVMMLRGDDTTGNSYPTETITIDGTRVKLIRCPAEIVHDVVDSTGAGDAFIGGVIYSLVSGLPLDNMLPLASQVAACKLRKFGARKGLPRRSDLNQDLFSRS